MERKEAIEIVRKNFPDNSFTMLREALETLIPELQNEDERIRKELIDLLNLLWRHYNFPYNRDKYEEFLAWLEKQGEQKETLCDKCKREQPSHSCQNITELERCYLEHEKQGKQKSIWSEDDKDTLEWICRIIYRAKQDKLITQKEESFLGKWIDKWLNHSSDWKPSEEQIMAFEHFVRSIGESGYASPYDNNTKLIYSLLNDLKNIRHER